MFFYVPIPRIDPRSLPRVVIDEVHLSVEVLGDVPPFRKRYLPIPSPWHISLRSKSIQNLSLSLSLSSCGRRAHIYARGREPRIRHARSRDGDGDGDGDSDGRNVRERERMRQVDRRERWAKGARRRRRHERPRERTGDPTVEGQVEGGRGGKHERETASRAGAARRGAVVRRGWRRNVVYTHTHKHRTYTHPRCAEGTARPGAYTRICVRSFSSLSSSFSFLSLSFSWLARATPPS